MKIKWLIIFIIGWFIYTLFDYYFFLFPYDILILLGFTIFSAIIIIRQIIKLIKERHSISTLRMLNVFVFSILLYLMFNEYLVERLIEKADWKISFYKRKEIVEEVKKNQLIPNVSWNSEMCKLPFTFPVVSNGGNEILINKNEKNHGLTISFYIEPGFIDGPSTYLVFTTDADKIKVIEEMIKNFPSNNWKIQDNWFRIFGNDIE